MTMTGTKLDVNIVNHGSVVLFHLNTPEAQAFVDESVSEDAQFFGGALVVEPRYAEALFQGMVEAGLEVR